MAPLDGRESAAREQDRAVQMFLGVQPALVLAISYEACSRDQNGGSLAKWSEQLFRM